MGNQDALKAREAWCINKVAEESGRVAETEESSWPDGWLRESAAVRHPVEVVSGHQRRANEDPKRGAPAARALRQAERDAKALGQPSVFGTHCEQGFAVPLDGKSALPLRLEPVDPVSWLEAAVLQKAAKNYADATKAVLVVDFQWMPLEEFELPELEGRLRSAGVSFAELWIVTDFGAQRVW